MLFITTFLVVFGLSLVGGGKIVAFEMKDILKLRFSTQNV